MDNWKVKVFGDDFAGGTAENTSIVSIVMRGGSGCWWNARFIRIYSAGRGLKSLRTIA